MAVLVSQDSLDRFWVDRVRYFGNNKRGCARSGSGGSSGKSSGVSTASGSKLVDVTTKEGAIAVASKGGKLGKVLKVSAGLLGLGALGAVGFAVLSGTKDEGEITLGHGDSIQDLIDKGEIDPSIFDQHPPDSPEVHEHPHDVSQITPEEVASFSEISNLPKFDDINQAKEYYANELGKLGIAVDPSAMDQLFGDEGVSGGKGEYNPIINDLRLTPDVIEGVRNGDPGAVRVLVHELGHTAQDQGGNITDELNAAYWTDTNFKGKSSYLEGQNELMARVAMARMTGASDVPGSYENETQTMAGVYAVLGQRTGQNPIQILTSTHSQGYVAPYQYENVVMQVFPNRVSAPIFTPNGYIYPSFPSIREMEQWLREDYGISSEAALQEILDQAAQ